MSLSVHVYRDRHGSWRARCTGTRDGREVTVSSGPWAFAGLAAAAAIGLWEWGPPGSRQASPGRAQPAVSRRRTDSAAVSLGSASNSTRSASTQPSQPPSHRSTLRQAIASSEVQ